MTPSPTADARRTLASTSPTPPSRLLRASVISAFVALAGPALAQESWTARASGTPETLSGATFGGGTFVAVGEAGTILTSATGEDWTLQTSNSTSALRAAAFGAGRFVAVGSGGTVLTSDDGGTSWQPRDAHTGLFLSGATYAAGRFVVVGGSGTIRSSVDGVTWQTVASPVTSFLQAVTFADGKFVAVGASGRIIHSPDGLDWSVAQSGTTTYFTAIAHAGGLFIAAGQNGVILTSPDAISWTYRPAGTFEWLRSITSGGGEIVAVGTSGTILTSTDGIVWMSAPSGVTDDLFGTAAGPGRFVAVGSPSTTSGDGLILTRSHAGSGGQTFDQWRQAEFNAAELADPQISGAHGDPDGDGIDNFSEYGHGLPPKVANGAERDRLPRIEIGPGGFAMITFERPAELAGLVDYAVCTSDDLVGWTPLPVSLEVLSETDGIERVRATDPQPAAGRRFYQIKLSGG